MIVNNRNKKRLIGGLIGAAGGFAYFGWTVIVTGGGHSNFIWLLMFVFLEFFGLYFVLMGVLSADLDKENIRRIFGILILLNVVLSIVFIFLWANNSLNVLGLNDPGDFSRTDKLWLWICTPVHFLPAIICTLLLIKTRKSNNTE